MGEPVHPKVHEGPTGMKAAQGQHIFCARFTPEHARLLAARTNNRLATSFDYPRADKEAFGSKSSILHSINVLDEVTQLFFHSVGLGFVSAQGTSLSNQLMDLVLEQPLGPVCKSSLILGVSFAA